MRTDEVAPACPVITQAFGCTSFAGEWAVSGAVCSSGWFHRGVDLAGSACCDTPLLAVGDGRVAAVGQTFTGSGGLGPGAILLNLADGMMAVYGHGYAEVSPGQAVSKGQRIGRVGSQGFSTGCHLHLEICNQLGTVPGGCMNPLSYNGPGDEDMAYQDAQNARDNETAQLVKYIHGDLREYVIKTLDSVAGIVRERVSTPGLSITGSRPDGTTDVYVLRGDGHITQVWIRPDGEMGSSDVSNGGKWSGLLRCGTNAEGQPYVEGLGLDESVWGVRWDGGAWDGPYRVT